MAPRRATSEPVSTAKSKEEILRFLGIGPDHPLAGLVSTIAGELVPTESEIGQAAHQVGDAPGAASRDIAPVSPDEVSQKSQAAWGGIGDVIGSWFGGGAKEPEPPPPAGTPWYDQKVRYGTQAFDRKLEALREKGVGYLPEHQWPKNARQSHRYEFNADGIPIPTGPIEGAYFIEGAETVSPFDGIDQQVNYGDPDNPYDLEVVDRLMSMITELSRIFPGTDISSEALRGRYQSSLETLLEMAVSGATEGVDPSQIASIKASFGEDTSGADAAIEALKGMSGSEAGVGSRALNEHINTVANTLWNRQVTVRRGDESFVKPAVADESATTSAQSAMTRSSGDDAVWKMFGGDAGGKTWNAINDRHGVALALRDIFEAVKAAHPSGTRVDPDQVRRVFKRAWRIGHPGTTLGPSTQKWIDGIIDGESAYRNRPGAHQVSTPSQTSVAPRQTPTPQPTPQPPPQLIPPRADGRVAGSAYG